MKSNKTGTYTAEVKDNDNDRSASRAYTINSSNTWEHKTLTYGADTTGAFDDDNGASLRLQFWLVSGSQYNSGTFTDGVFETEVNANRVHSSQVNLGDTVGNEWYITGIKLEVGEQSTPFEHRSFGDEFMRCQRYYQEIHGGSCEPSSSSVVETSFTRLPMRAAATGSVSAAIDIEDPNVTTYTQSSGAIAIGNATARAEKIGLSNFSSLGTSKSFFIKTTGGHIQLDAEL